jgi:multimeric flavodoxin WrbA
MRIQFPYQGYPDAGIQSPDTRHNAGLLNSKRRVIEMKKVMFINGSPNENGCISTAMDEVISILDQNGIESEKLWLGKKAIPDCIACHSCQETGSCIFGDEVNAVAADLDEVGAIVVGSPVYYGGPNGRLTSFLDRLFFSVPDEKFNGKLGASIVSCRRGGASAAFERLNQYFLMENMHVVASQYWNQVHGSSAADVKKDLEGLQTMRTLGRNIAWLMKAIDAGEQNGIQAPAHEAKTFTNFI